MKFLERPDIQIKQAGRAIKNLTSSRHLKLGAKYGFKKWKKYWGIDVVGGMVQGVTSSISAEMITYSLTNDIVLTSLLGTAMLGAPLVINNSYKLGIGFFRGVRVPEEALDSLEEIIKKDYYEYNFQKVTDIFEKNKGDEERIKFIQVYSKNTSLNVDELEDILDKTQIHFENADLDLISKLIEKSTSQRYIIDNIKKSKKLKGVSKELFNLYLDNHKLGYGSIISTLKEFEESLEKTSDFKKGLLNIAIKNTEHVGYFNYILNSQLDEKNEKLYKLALEKGDPYNFDNYRNSINSLQNNKELYPLLEYCINNGVDSRGLYLIGAIENKFFKKSSNSQKIIKDIMKKSRRQNFYTSIKIVDSLLDFPQGLEELANQGKKKRGKLISKLTPLYDLFTPSIMTETIKNYYEKGMNIEKMLESDLLREKTLEFFDCENIGLEISNHDIVKILGAYSKINRSQNVAREVFSTYISGKSLWDLKEKNSNYNEFKKNNFSLIAKWKEGYKTLDKKVKSFKINHDGIIKENYTEALTHLRDAGLEIDKREDIESHAKELCFIYQNDNDLLIKDAVEHLEEIINYSKKNDIKISEIKYGTGNFKDFLYLGHNPENTCLGFERSNNDCLLSMICQPNIQPFFAYVDEENNKKIIGRSILRIENNTLIVDDIYGNTGDMLLEISNYASELGIEVAIHKKLEYKLNDTEIKHVKKNKLFKDLKVGDTKELYYSDSLGGRINDEGYETSFIAA